jgi:hypothetical protein
MTLDAVLRRLLRDAMLSWNGSTIHPVPRRQNLSPVPKAWYVRFVGA